LTKQAGRFDPTRAELATCLCGIAWNMIWKQIKTRDRWRPSSADDEEGETSALDDDPDAILSRSESVVLVRHGMDDLPLPLKEANVLCEFKELTYERAAAVLGVPVGTVRSRLHRSKAPASARAAHFRNAHRIGLHVPIRGPVCYRNSAAPVVDQTVRAVAGCSRANRCRLFPATLLELENRLIDREVGAGFG
jgi:RNA polymerase sigma factor (sigma-70 family)